jgi:hypothetical protein
VDSTPFFSDPIKLDLIAMTSMTEPSKNPENQKRGLRKYFELILPVDLKTFIREKYLQVNPN